MTVNTIVTPSSQIDSILPGFINETYTEFVKFVTNADESEERIGFSQNLLQNLQGYRDFNTYRNKIVKKGVLSDNISATDTELTLEDGLGFPEENGVLYIDDEIIYYRQRIDNTFYDLQRGASGTVILPTFTSKGTYRITTAAAHTTSSVVINVSMLFLASMLDTIFESYAADIIPERIAPEINTATLLENLKDFFQSKGSKLGVKALFKVLFAENDVEVTYPGDRMLIPSKSTWNEAEIVRVVPIPQVFCPPSARLLTPDKFINGEITFFIEGFEKEDTILGTAVCEYAFSYVYESEVQYELNLQKDSVLGKTRQTSKTVLTRNLSDSDTTITVETTIGFPEVGVVYIENEGISYTSKSLNQFFGCKRGYVGVAASHNINNSVYGTELLRAETFIDDVKYESYCFVNTLANGVRVIDGGVLHTINDEITITKPAGDNPRLAILDSYLENYSEQLVTEASGVGDVSFLTCAVNAIYFNPEFSLIGTTGLPYYTIGVFGNNPGINQYLTGYPITYAIPNIGYQKESDTADRGTNQIGLFVDGVAAYSASAPRNEVTGSISKFNILAEGDGYINPTVLVDGQPDAEATVVNGRITKVITSSVSVYTSNPTVEITSGKGGSFELEFDLYGRITNVTIKNKGNYYKDIPTLLVVDTSNRGRGALLTCTSGGNDKINSVSIVAPGIDYNPDTTKIEIFPVGSGALVTATAEFYTFNRYQEVINNTSWSFDSGNGFVYEGPNQSGPYTFRGNANVENPPPNGVSRNDYYRSGGSNRVASDEWIGIAGETVRVNQFMLFNGVEWEIEDRSTFGYVANPTQLRTKVNDTSTTKHSPILGWALDGNPIYGPYAYANRFDASEGIYRMISGYQLADNRDDIIPGGGGNSPGTAPPTVGDWQPGAHIWPMGTFTQDFVYQEGPTALAGSKLTRNQGDTLITDQGFELETDAVSTYTPGQLDKNNGRICNTPEFPNELYPEGIYCYFVTVESDGVTPAYPYIIGENYQNSATEWYLDWSTSPFPEKIRFGSVPYTPARNFISTLIQRYRNPYLSSVNEDITVTIDSVTTGGINSIIVEDAKPTNCQIGDEVYFDNAGVGGSGAEGYLIAVGGKTVVQSGGSVVATQLISHRQQLDLSANVGVNYTFGVDTEIVGWNDAISVVESYDASTMLLILQTKTPQLIQPNPNFTVNPDGDPVFEPVFYDNLYRPVKLFQSSPNIPSLGLAPLGSETPNDVIVSYFQPKVGIGGLAVKPGDLWWSIYDGRLFIYYNDGSTSQWVVTQPLGTTPLGDLSDSDRSLASDTILVQGESNPPDTTLVAGGDNIITIANKAPDSRPNNDPNKIGDLWWSPVTGCLQIWYTDGIISLAGKGVYAETNSQWVITDPAGIVPLAPGPADDSADYSLDEIYPPESPASLGSSIYTNEIAAIISGNAPKTQVDGTPLQLGNLWWSPKTGKLYIYWESNGNNIWTVCNPSGSITGQYALDYFPGGEVGPGPRPDSPSGQIDELPTQDLLFFNNLDFFFAGDLIDFQTGAPGNPDLTETSRILARRSVGPDEDNSALVVRGTNRNENNPQSLFLPNGTLMINKTRAIYKVRCDEDTELISGDIVIIKNSKFNEINGLHFVTLAGSVVPADVAIQVNTKTGQVSKVSLISGGEGYRDDFLITFTGGGGFSAFARATTSPLSDGGSVISVELLNGGYGYTSVPTPILGDQISNREFIFDVRNVYGDDNDDVAYSALAQRLVGPPGLFKVSSPGANYTDIPAPIGLVKRASDRAITKVTLSGESAASGEIVSVTVIDGGNRYDSPTAIFIDEAGSGSGATASVVVVDGSVTEVNVIDGGSGYKQPVLALVEESGKFVATTNNIGTITSMSVKDPGLKVSGDSTIKPEIQITTKVVVSNLKGEFIPGEDVYQGTEDRKLVTATVSAFNDKTQQVTLTNVVGIISNLQHLYVEGKDTRGLVVTQGDADTRLTIGGSSTPAGTFINDTSMLGSNYAHIQDSYYYQWFSYNIQSPLQKVQYETFVKDIIHPSGFIQFSELDINQSVNVTVVPDEPYLFA